MESSLKKHEKKVSAYLKMAVREYLDKTRFDAVEALEIVRKCFDLEDWEKYFDPGCAAGLVQSAVRVCSENPERS